jgi:hypothetical protein
MHVRPPICTYLLLAALDGDNALVAVEVGALVLEHALNEHLQHGHVQVALCNTGRPQSEPEHQTHGIAWRTISSNHTHQYPIWQEDTSYLSTHHELETDGRDGVVVAVLGVFTQELRVHV